MTSYVLVSPADRTHPRCLDLAHFARAAQVHPEFVQQLVSLGLIEPSRDSAGTPWFTYADLATVARIRRLRAGFGINYAALGLVLDLLERVGTLEAAVRGTPNGRRPTWT